jgi:hypothetical protein
MGDTIRDLFGCHLPVAARWSKAQETAVTADQPKVAFAEAHDVGAIVDLGDADRLSRQRLADEDLHLIPPSWRTRRT